MQRRSLLTITALRRRSSGADNDCIPSGVTVESDSEKSKHVMINTDTFKTYLCPDTCLLYILADICTNRLKSFLLL